MNSNQQRFFDFIMERVELENQYKAKELLNESFDKQNKGTFNKEYIKNFIPRMLELIKPEYVDEVKDIMLNYKS